MKRWLKIIARTIGLSVLGFAGLLFFNQHRMIYFPRPYGPAYKMVLPKMAVELSYTTSQGRQRGYYLPPANAPSAAPERLWALFGGNGSLALDWSDFIARDPNRRDGFLLVDYPGYGWCEGSAEPSTIEESADKALAELAAHLRTTPAGLEPKLNVLGHSLGCAAGLQFAARHSVQRVVLLAPFTNLRAMARRTVGWPLCFLVLHNFDNRARLAELAARPQPPRVTIFHGVEDTLIPIQMGRSLAAKFPKMITFHEVPDADHNSVLLYAHEQVLATMNE